MYSNSRTLIALKLLLLEFGINVGETLNTKQTRPNIDLISSYISLLQILHKMDYEFDLVFVAGKHRIRSSLLVKQINELQKSLSDGKLVILERQFKTNEEIKNKVGYIKDITKTDNPIKHTSWVFLLGFYNEIGKICPQKSILEIMMRDYTDLVQYLDLAEEKLSEIYNEVRNAQ